MTHQEKIAVPTEERKEDLYYAVHKGLRLGHARLLVDLGATDPADPAAVAAVLDRLETHLRLGESHLEHEERAIHAALDKAAPGTTDHADAEHDAHIRSFRELRGLVGALRRHRGDRSRSLRRLYQRFAVFVAADLVHMNDEETTLQPALERLLTAAEIAGIHQAIVADIPAEDMVAFMRLILAAATAPERRATVEGLQAAMPAADFAGFMAAVTGAAWVPGDWAGLAAALR